MWKDFRNLFLVLLTVFTVLYFSVFLYKKEEKLLVYYDSILEKTQIETREQLEKISEKNKEKEIEKLLLEAEKKRQEELLKQKAIQTYTPPVTVVTPTLVPAPIVVQPKPSRKTRAS